MKSNLKIYTASLEDISLEELIKNEYLPIFAIKRLDYFPTLKRYSNAPIHLKSLAPSDMLQKGLNDGKISGGEFEKRFAIEMCKVPFLDIVKKLERLSEYNNAKGVVIITPEKSFDHSYRRVLSMILNYSGFLLKEVEEYGKRGDK